MPHSAAGAFRMLLVENASCNVSPFVCQVLIDKKRHCGEQKDRCNIDTVTARFCCLFSSLQYLDSDSRA